MIKDQEFMATGSETAQVMANCRAAAESDGWIIDPERSAIGLLRATRGTSELALALEPSDNVDALVSRRLMMIADGDTSGDDLPRLVKGLPYTTSELLQLQADMPLTSRLPDELADYFNEEALGSLTSEPLSGVGGILTIHHQTDFLVLIEAALRMGLDPHLTTVIDKQYRYKYTARVDGHLKRRFGISVFQFDHMIEGISDHFRRVYEDREVAGRDTWKPTLVLDDGGYVYPRLEESFPTTMNMFLDIVEQTASGIRAIYPYEAHLRIPFFNVAESDLKATVEAPGVATAALHAVRALIPDEKFQGRRALVIGHGRIGAALAEILRAFRFVTAVHDTNKAQLLAARERGYLTHPDLSQLISEFRPHFIFGCAGKHSMGVQEFASINCDCFLISLTSRNYEFALEELAALAVEEVSRGKVGKVFLLGQGARVVLVADGFPVNFHGAESMPNQHSDLIMASMLFGGLALVHGRRRFESGHTNREVSNEALNRSQLLEKYYAIYE